MEPSKREWIRATLACLMLALLLCAVSNNLHGRFATRGDVIRQQFAILHGEPLPFGDHAAPMKMWRNRILFPLLLETASEWRALSVNQWYAVLRLLTAFTALVVLWRVIRSARGGTPDRALLGCALLTYMLLCTVLSFGLDIPSDFPDAALAAASLWAVVNGARAWSILLAVAGAANRESAAFVGLLWLCVHGVSDRGKVVVHECAFGAALSGAAYGLVIALRHVFGAQFVETPQVLAFASIKFWLTGFLRHPSLDGWPLLAAAMWGLPLMLIWPARRRLALVHARLLTAAALMALVSIVFGSINELRIFIPSAVVVAYVVAAAPSGSAKGRDDPQSA